MDVLSSVDWHYYKSNWFLVTTPLALFLSVLLAALMEGKHK